MITIPAWALAAAALTGAIPGIVLGILGTRGYRGAQIWFLKNNLQIAEGGREHQRARALRAETRLDNTLDELRRIQKKTA